MEYITLFNNINTELIINNCYISIDIVHGNTLIYSIFNDNNEFIVKGNEFTNYLKNYYFDKNENMYVYYLIDKDYNNSIDIKDEFEYIDEDVYCFITAFSAGTTHGFSSLLDLYLQYFGNKKIIVYKNTQKGILDLLNLFINKDLIIYLDNNTKHKFKSIEFIDIKRHIFNLNTDIDELNKFISKYIKEDNILHKRIGIFKTNKTTNLTSDGTLSEYKCIKLCKINKIDRIKPEKLNEIQVIKKLRNTELYITTFGTSFTKNLFYLSDKCKKIIVLVIGIEHNNQIYSRLELKDNISIPFNYKNIKINYILIDKYRTFNLDELPDYNFCKFKNNKFTEYVFNFDEINLDNYKNNYPDLKDLSKKELLNHYNEIGKKEDRIHSFSIKDKYINTEIYVLNYPDLKDLTEFQLKQHYFVHGKKEGRVHEYRLNEDKEEKYLIIKAKNKLLKEENKLLKEENKLLKEEIEKQKQQKKEEEEEEEEEEESKRRSRKKRRR